MLETFLEFQLQHRECNVTDMMTCGNSIIRDFLQKTKVEYASDDGACLPGFGTSYRNLENKAKFRILEKIATNGVFT